MYLGTVCLPTVGVATTLADTVLVGRDVGCHDVHGEGGLRVGGQASDAAEQGNTARSADHPGAQGAG